MKHNFHQMLFTKVFVKYLSNRFYTLSEPVGYELCYFRFLVVFLHNFMTTM